MLRISACPSPSRSARRAQVAFLAGIDQVLPPGRAVVDIFPNLQPPHAPMFVDDDVRNTIIGHVADGTTIAARLARVDDDLSETGDKRPHVLVLSRSTGAGE
jgi:hypothetical protein